MQINLHKQKDWDKVAKTYNCAKVFAGTICSGGTNEFERSISYDYQVLEGEVTTKKVGRVRVKGSNTEGYTELQGLILYPSTNMAKVIISGRRCFTLNLIRAKRDGSSTMFRFRI